MFESPYKKYIYFPGGYPVKILMHSHTHIFYPLHLHFIDYVPDISTITIMVKPFYTNCEKSSNIFKTWLSKGCRK